MKMMFLCMISSLALLLSYVIVNLQVSIVKCSLMSWLQILKTRLIKKKMIRSLSSVINIKNQSVIIR
ncbi:hypothetical protein FGO68_gene5332 [Halteria grandinella]|uniref:Uncharacterized protein n=1 Tax=Halteria grandinella TaxID=5974 RepID=A0A8J8P559_HALGN|nr:hypothetical protein FGO68_gene5332 [Halteria grandinella]